MLMVGVVVVIVQLGEVCWCVLTVDNVGLGRHDVDWKRHHTPHTLSTTLMPNHWSVMVQRHAKQPLDTC
eukprot:gnl/Chilomastix_caulleri/4660.p2 GENE.gnl/Chilomastix_caulleri/4660~~gnl/Chilomastix_caulleri/4660.p2  ORF type:complete len:69 (+),score=22.22 gnl/Chilomastix_caulleri/4660:135-341(+)